MTKQWQPIEGTIVAAPSIEKVVPIFWSWRAVAIGILLLPLNLYWIGVTEGLWHALHMTTLSLPMNALMLLLVLTWLNRFLRFVSPQLALQKDELLLIHIVLTVQSVFIGHDSMVSLMGVIPAAAWYSNPANRWETLFFRHLPDWLVINEKSVVRNFYLGGLNFYGSGLEVFWLKPAIFWTILMTTIFVAYLSLTAPFYRRWAHEERLSFPILRLPIDIVEGRLRWRGLAFWSGFFVAAFVDMVNHLNWLYPRIPFLKVRARDRDLVWYLTEHPFNAIGSTPLALYPFIIGYGYLMPLDLCISAWFFYLLRKFERIWGAWRGWTRLPRFPYENEQAAGSAVAIALLLLWRSKTTLANFWKRYSERNNLHPILPRTAAMLLTISFFVCCLISVKAGMGLGIALLFWFIHFLIALTVARLRAEAGPPTHSLLFANPQDLLLATFGTRSFRPRELTTLALFFWFNRLNRNHPAPVIMEGWRLTEIANANFARSAWLMTAMTVLSITGCFVLYPHLFYREGAETRIGEVVWVGQDTFNRLASWIGNPTAPDQWARSFVGFGFAFTLLLNALYHRLPWWGLHPLGYLLGTSFAVDYYWLCLLLSSTAKWLLIHYGGVRFAQAATPFFVGLILGEGLVACGWSVYGIIVHKPMYDAWW
ncbi:MAG: hypothetical protein NZ805_09070 [Armatimonadetes bacterium]|nr:hypothetical protein [Armatimonadota bacterium]MDW8029286.1 DUF6785 family protein [Armatimonadota bacterium]